MPKKSTKSVKTLRTKKDPWFYSIRGSYLPKNTKGWLTYIPYIAFLLGSERWAFNVGGTLPDQLFRLFPVWVAAAVVMHFIAKSTS